jgi:Holliday junction resolvase
VYLRRKRRDATHKPIVKALRKVGASVVILADVGGDCPDILVGYGGKTLLMELKPPGGKVTEGQLDFQAKWRGGPVRVIESIEAALRFIGCLRDVPPAY